MNQIERFMAQNPLFDDRLMKKPVLIDVAS